MHALHFSTSDQPNCWSLNNTPEFEKTSLELTLAQGENQYEHISPDYDEVNNNTTTKTNKSPELYLWWGFCNSSDKGYIKTLNIIKGKVNELGTQLTYYDARSARWQ